MTFKISDICDINSNNLSSKDNYEYINYLDTSNLTEGVIDSVQKLVVGKDKIPSRAKRKVKKNDVLISTVRPNQKHYGILRKMNENLIVSTGFAVLSANEDRVVPEYLYRFLTQDSVTNYLQAVGETSTSTYPSIKPSDIGSLEIQLPSLEEQKVISKILSDLDKKIEVNNQINDNLEKMAQAIFKQWFVDFEFPNEDGEPYKSSGGEMVESELGIIPKESKIVELGDIIDLFDSKRIPLSKNEREKREKIYPYYGAASLMDYVDDYIFDGVYILMGEDGTVVTSEGFPVLQYVWGKFWVNNHAHVIKGKGKAHDEFIYVLLKSTNIKSIITGAVQPKINQQNLKTLKIVMPTDEKILVKYADIVKKSFEQIRTLSDEIDRLTKLRDLLLPKLMSGEIRVPVKQ